MKRLIALTILILSVFTISAQVKFGAGGGLNMSSLRGDVDNPKTKTGFNGGIMVEVKAPVAVGVELDALFSTKGASYEVFNTEADLSLTYLDLPLVAKLYTAKVMSLQLGIQYSLLLAADFEGNDIKDQLKGSDFAAVVGLGVDVSKVRFSARYAYGLTSIDDTGADVKNGVLGITVGIWLKN